MASQGMIFGIFVLNSVSCLGIFLKQGIVLVQISYRVSKIFTIFVLNRVRQGARPEL